MTVGALAYQPSLLDALEPEPAAPARLLRVAAPPVDRDEPARPEPANPAGAPQPAESAAAAHRTFEDVVVAAWEGLTSAHAAECLVCGGDVRPRYGAGPKPVAGTCRDCGTEIV